MPLEVYAPILGTRAVRAYAPERTGITNSLVPPSPSPPRRQVCRLGMQVIDSELQVEHSLTNPRPGRIVLVRLRARGLHWQERASS
jgi:hypothetical protein